MKLWDFCLKCVMFGPAQSQNKINTHTHGTNGHTLNTLQSFPAASHRLKNIMIELFISPFSLHSTEGTE